MTGTDKLKGNIMNTKPAAQLSLEAIIERNKAEAETLKKKADEKLAENERISAEMEKVLASRSQPPTSVVPSERMVAAYRNGHAMSKLGLEHGPTEMPPAPSVAPLSTKSMAEREVVYAAVAIVRSWQRRHKKSFHNQERELMNAVERLTWEP